MSDAAADKKDEKDGAAKGGGNKKLLIIAVAVNMLLVGGLGFVALSGHNGAADKKSSASHGGNSEGDDEEEGDEEEGDEENSHGKGKFGPLIEVGSFVANLASTPGEPPRYAKATLHVEAYNEEAKARVEAALVPIKTEALMMLSNSKPEDMVGQDKMMALSDNLLKRANKLIGKKSIKRVYFSELVIQ